MSLKLTLTAMLGALAVLLVVGCRSGERHAAPDSAGSSDASRLAQQCAALSETLLAAGRVDGAEAYAAGEILSGGVTGGAEAGAGLCRARLTLSSGPGSEIKVEVWLPDQWNNRLMGFGGGGFDGGLSAGSSMVLNQVTRQGYAAVIADAGHPAGTPVEEWAHGNPQKIEDFGYRANALAASAAKALAEAYYGQQPSESFFQGCSNGGRDGLILASRFPEAYDGIIAGAPAARYVEVLTLLLWHDEVVNGANGAANLGSKLPAVHAGVLAECDGLDGVEDGVLENPLKCEFDPASLLCAGADTPACLTRDEVEALRKIYAGPTLADGRVVVAGPALGSEGAPDNWSAWVTGDTPALAGQEFFRWIVFGDPEWSLEAYELDRDYPVALERVGPLINADDFDLSTFTARGGRLIIYQGWNDPAITAQATLENFEQMQQYSGPGAKEQIRLFMVPGMTHCAGGPGATRFDMQAVLEAWFDTDVAPERVIASRPGEDLPALTRPLCAWPRTAHYTGTGSANDASRFVCR